MADKEKKPIFKRWWFWLIIVIVVIALMTGGGEETDEPEETDQANEVTETDDDPGTTEDPDEDADEEEEEAEPEPEEEDEPNERDNSSAEETTLNTGTFVVGSDIPEGRYVITGDGSGNLFVYDNGRAVVNEILDSSGDFGVTSVTIDLEDGQEIEISGISSVMFTPAETSLSNTLSTGTWIVGLDIEPGRYNASTPSGSGNFFVYNDRGLAQVNEILDASGDFGVEQVTVNLEDGQVIEISGLNQVDFEPRD